MDGMHESYKQSAMQKQSKQLLNQSFREAVHLDIVEAFVESTPDLTSFRRGLPKK